MLDYLNVVEVADLLELRVRSMEAHVYIIQHSPSCRSIISISYRSRKSTTEVLT